MDKKLKARVAMVLFGLTILVSLTFAGLWGFLLPDALKGSLWGSSMTSCQAVQPDDTWFQASMIALLLNAIFAGFAFMFSGLFGPRILAWNKNFISTLVTSAIIVSILFLANRTMYDWGMSQIDMAWENTIIIRDSIIAQFVMMTGATAWLSFNLNLSPYFRPAGIIGIHFSLQPAFRPIFDGLGISLSMLSVAVSEWYVHEFLICFAKTRMMAFFMPLGLFLRSFYPTMRAGNVLIALAIGFYFVYPFMVNMTAYSIERYFSADNQQGAYTDMNGDRSSSREWCVSHLFNPIANPCYLGLIGEDAWSIINDTMDQSTDNSGTSFAVYAIMHFFTNSHPATLLTMGIAIFMLAVFKAVVFYIVIISILMPLFNLFITLTVTKEIAAALGTDIDLSALEKLI